MSFFLFFREFRIVLDISRFLGNVFNEGNVKYELSNLKLLSIFYVLLFRLIK